MAASDAKRPIVATSSFTLVGKGDLGTVSFMKVFKDLVAEASADMSDVALRAVFPHGEDQGAAKPAITTSCRRLSINSILD